MDTTEPCCSYPPANSNYIPQGEDIILDGLKVYVTGDPHSDCVLICLYDSFGCHPNTKMFCDKLGEASGFNVVLPDVLRRDDLSQKENSPPILTNTTDPNEGKRAWEKSVLLDLEFLINYFKISGVQMFGIFGFCWGGRMALYASQSQEFANCIRASVLIHPSMVVVADAEQVKCPTLLITSRDDMSIEPFYEKLQERFPSGKSHIQSFEKMGHGFSTTQANFEDQVNRKYANEAVKTTSDFFRRILINASLELRETRSFPRSRFPCCFPCVKRPLVDL